MRFHFLPSAVLLLFFQIGLWAQSNGVQGRITDISGEPLAGAIVMVPGQDGSPSLTAMADIDGNYSIGCKAGDILEFDAAGLDGLAVDLAERFHQRLFFHSLYLSRKLGDKVIPCREYRILHKN